jgi:DNA-binding NtrC family response regulator
VSSKSLLPVRVLLVDDDPTAAVRLLPPLERQGYSTTYSACGEPAVNTLRDQHFHVVLLCACYEGPKGLYVLTRVRALQLDAQFIVLTDDKCVATAVTAMKLGAFDYLIKPVNVDELLIRVERALQASENQREVARLRRHAKRINPAGIVGTSAAIRRVIDLVERVGPTNSSVLVLGQTGTGKELVARALHELSPRKERRFVPVSCSALPENLLESELFGHVRGSFTGAVSNRRGLFEEAEGGSVFLDEIESLSLGMQSKLLRVVEERTVQRVGASHDIPVDFRLIAASNRDLGEMVERGEFRDDLYYRLNVFPIHVPPLSERPDDIPLLVLHFRERFAENNEFKCPQFSPSAVMSLARYDWPGNVRQLRNYVERTLIMCAGKNEIVIEPPEASEGVNGNFLARPALEEWNLKRLEMEYIAVVLEATDGNRNRAARILGIDRRTLYRKIRELQSALPAYWAFSAELAFIQSIVLQRLPISPSAGRPRA